MKYYSHGKEPDIGWEIFLKERCEIREEYNGVVFYAGKSACNCNYIVLPSGMVISNCGYHGKALMNRIREKGVEAVEADATDLYREIDRLTRKIGVYDDGD